MPLESPRPGDPERVAGFRVTGRLGSGGMGVVYLGIDDAGRRVAIKVIRFDFAADREFRVRFRREVAAARAVDGASTARLLDADPDADHPWMATEYIDGPSLARCVSDGGPLRPDRVDGLAVGLAEAISAIHAAGVVHRDLKPANVIMGPAGPRVIDFGIAAAAEDTVATRSGVLIGSPGFMAPEQVTGETKVGPPADVFAWGLTVLFAAIGRSPFGAGRPDALLYRVVHDEPELAGLPAALRLIVADTLRKQPDERPTAGELLSRLMPAIPDSSAETRQLLSDIWPPPRLPRATPLPPVPAPSDAGTVSPRSADRGPDRDPSPSPDPDRDPSPDPDRDPSPSPDPDRDPSPDPDRDPSPSPDPVPEGHGTTAVRGRPAGDGRRRRWYRGRRSPHLAWALAALAAILAGLTALGASQFAAQDDRNGGAALTGTAAATVEPALPGAAPPDGSAGRPGAPGRQEPAASDPPDGSTPTATPVPVPAGGAPPDPLQPAGGGGTDQAGGQGAAAAGAAGEYRGRVGHLDQAAGFERFVFDHDTRLVLLDVSADSEGNEANFHPGPDYGGDDRPNFTLYTACGALPAGQQPGPELEKECSGTVYRLDLGGTNASFGYNQGSFYLRGYFWVNVAPGMHQGYMTVNLQGVDARDAVGRGAAS